MRAGPWGLSRDVGGSDVQQRTDRGGGDDRRQQAEGAGPGGRGEDVNGAMAFTGGQEDLRASVNGESHRYSSPVTQPYRRGDGQSNLAHRHADTLPSQMGDGLRVGR
jgi:hypothetical protein